MSVLASALTCPRHRAPARSPDAVRSAVAGVARPSRAIRRVLLVLTALLWLPAALLVLALVAAVELHACDELGIDPAEV